MARIQLENVKKKFGKVTALDGVTIDVKDNEFFVLFGPAGAGKTPCSTASPASRCPRRA